MVEEIVRVAQAASAIEQRDVTRLGDLMRASHASLRDQFEVSETNVDRLVDLLNAKGFDIARRTVAKYREAMGIGSSVQRRRQKALAAVM